LEAVHWAVKEYAGEIAAIIVEPVAGNMGVVPPRAGFLEGLRRLCDQEDIILIFDEVITGFRVAWGGAQALYHIKPDLTCLGKIIGGGLPVGAYGGRRDLMAHLAPEGPVYQAGTLSGNPVAVAAGRATLEALQPHSYRELEEKGAWLAEALTRAAARHHLPLTINRVGSMLTLFFTEGPVTNLAEAKKSDVTAFAAFFQSMLAEGIYLPPSQFEAWFISLAHTMEDLEKTVEAAERGWSR
ncbi:MAG: aminotransferase class III-fold pyridoxal phosphate-dependent enzyme, partial [Deltaproteobacteria bacterium]|nr:aminotransferase class III-fold pyridoxal phosphate-dependent enzyme [Deltaproteobacteria bacterium]